MSATSPLCAAASSNWWTWPKVLNLITWACFELRVTHRPSRLPSQVPKHPMLDFPNCLPQTWRHAVGCQCLKPEDFPGKDLEHCKGQASGWPTHCTIQWESCALFSAADQWLIIFVDASGTITSFLGVEICGMSLRKGSLRRCLRFACLSVVYVQLAAVISEHCEVSCLPVAECAVAIYWDSLHSDYHLVEQKALRSTSAKLLARWPSRMWLGSLFRLPPASMATSQLCMTTCLHIEYPVFPCEISLCTATLMQWVWEAHKNERLLNTRLLDNFKSLNFRYKFIATSLMPERDLAAWAEFWPQQALIVILVFTSHAILLRGTPEHYRMSEAVHLRFLLMPVHKQCQLSRNIACHPCTYASERWMPLKEGKGFASKSMIWLIKLTIVW